MRLFIITRSRFTKTFLLFSFLLIVFCKLLFFKKSFDNENDKKCKIAILGYSEDYYKKILSLNSSSELNYLISESSACVFFYKMSYHSLIFYKIKMKSLGLRNTNTLIKLKRKDFRYLIANNFKTVLIFPDLGNICFFNVFENEFKLLKNRLKIYFIVDLIKTNISIQIIGYLRKASEISKFIFLNSESLKYGLHSLGLNEKNICFILDCKKKFKEDFVISKYIYTLLKYNHELNTQLKKESYLNHKNLQKLNSFTDELFGKDFSIKANDSVFCLYADFNLQLNIKINNKNQLTTLGLVSQETYGFVNIESGFDFFTFKNYSKNFSIDFTKNTLYFESINIGLTIILNDSHFEIKFHKISQYLFATGLIGKVITDCNEISWKDCLLFSKINLENSLIESHDIFSHFSKSQYSINNNKLFNVYDLEENHLNYNNDKSIFLIEGLIYTINSFATVNRKIYIYFYKSKKFQMKIKTYEVLTEDNEKEFDICLVYSLNKRNEQFSKVLKSSNKKVNKFYFRQYGIDAIPTLETWKVDKSFYLIQYIPWEFTSIAERWLPYLNNHINEIWTPSNYNYKIYIRNGVLPEKIFIIPYGISYEKFFKNVTNYSLIKNKKKFIFLSVGGMVKRKGIDLTLEAYLKAFTSQDDVCLVYHSIFHMDEDYANSVKKKIKEIQSNKSLPEVIYLSEKISESDQIRLYKTANVYVSAYRSEGFGLTIMEAMASGLPPIIPNYGPAIEFCPQEGAYFVETKEKNCNSFPCGKMSVFGLKTFLQPKWGEPQIDSLSAQMIIAYKNRNLLKKKAEIVKKYAKYYDWNNVTNIMMRRIEEIIKIKQNKA